MNARLKPRAPCGGVVPRVEAVAARGEAVGARGFSRAIAIAAALLVASCAPKLLKLPTGPVGPAPDARDALTEATTACQKVTTLSAEIAVSGSARGSRLRARLLTGVARPASARIEAVAPFGAPLFIFVARANDATLLLPRDDRVLQHGRSDEVLEAVAGVPLDPIELRSTLTGCAVAADVEGARQIGDDWRVLQDGPNHVYLRRDPHPAAWRLVATLHPSRVGRGEWRAEYRDFQDGLPRTIHLAAADRKQFDLTLALSQVDINKPLGQDVFTVQIPRSADPITLEELKDARAGVRKD